MARRPLCILLLVLISLILLRGKNDSFEDESNLSGKKELVCQIQSVEGQGDSRWLLVRDVMEGETRFCDKMKVYPGKNTTIPDELKIGNIIRIQGKTVIFTKPGNPGQFDEYRYYHDMGISCGFSMESVSVVDSSYNWLQQKLSEIRTCFFQNFMACLPEDEAGVLSAMVLGEKCALTDETKELYQSAGISHILAISGLHISLIGAGLFYFLRRFIMPMKMAVITSSILLILYGELTGFPIATERAVIMMICTLGARFLGRRYDLYSSLALSGLIQLSVHPMELFHSGFLLSYGTVFGIAFFVRKFQENGSKNRLLCSLFGAVGIQMITLPIVLYFYYEVNPYSVFANLFVLPLVSVVIGMSVLAGFVTSWSLTAGKIFVGVVHEILMFYEWLCQCIEKLPWSDCILGRPAVWQIVLYYGLILLWCVWRKKCPRSGSHRWKGVLLVAALFVLCWRSSLDGSMMITNLDVGQGDCACVRLNGKTLLIDGGSSDVSSVGKYRISKYLKYYGISKIDYMFFSHADADHTNGLLEILEDNNFMGFQIGMVVLPGLEKKDENYQQLVEKCKKRGVAVAYMSKGDSLNVRGMAVRCLHPANDYDWTSENNYSLVLQLSYGDFQGVFMGDLEQGAESEIMNEITKSDYLKVAHHGSKGASSEELLKKIKPAIAVLSAGKNNRYGHPSPEVLERLQSVSAKSYCTIDEGAVTVSTDGKKILVDTYFSATYDKGRN